MLKNANQDIFDIDFVYAIGKVLQYREKITDISALATNEATLESMLNRIIETWKKTDLRLVKDHARDTFIITATDEIQILLEESQV